MYFSIVALVLTKALLTEVCDALNVTVNPGPVVMVTESDNLTLSCLVSQRKRSSGVLVLRWLFSPRSPPPSPPPPSPPPLPSPRPPPPPPAEVLIVRMGIKKMNQYGNYTRRFPQPKFRLQEEQAGEAYRLLIVNVTAEDQGVYACRVQEIRRHRNSWRASSNGTDTTTLTVHFTLQEDGSREAVLRLFSDLYLCAVLICSLGLLSIFLFTLVLGCQHLLRRNHRLKASYLLVKCPESSSGETVTGSTCSSSSSPRTQRKESIRTPHSKARPKAAPMPPQPEEPPLPPPHMLTKVPVAPQRLRKPRRLKNQTRRSNPQRDYQEDSLTYAELELVRPHPERPISSPTGPAETPTPNTITSTTTSTIITTMDANTDTVYAQILFQEKQL